MGPLRTPDRRERIGVLRFLGRPYVRILETTRRIARHAAGLRASLGLRVPDALVIANAAEDVCDFLIGNDRSWRTHTLPVLCLSDFVGSR